jgi:hypothetical protein
MSSRIDCYGASAMYALLKHHPPGYEDDDDDEHDDDDDDDEVMSAGATATACSFSSRSNRLHQSFVEKCRALYVKLTFNGQILVNCNAVIT